MDFKRREFIKISGITAAGSLIIPPFFNSCKTTRLSDNAESYLNHFEVTQDLLRKVISAAMEKGADYADLFFEHTLENYSSLEDGKVNSAYSNIDYGVGIRVLKGDQTGYAYSESITSDAMLKAARTAANIADGSKVVSPVKINEYISPNYYPLVNSWEDTSVKDKIPFIQRINDNIFAADKQVTKVNAVLGDSTSYILFFNSEGHLAWDYRPMVMLYGVCIMEKNGQIENFFVGRSYRMGSEFLTNELVDKLSKEVVEKTSIIIHCNQTKSR